MNAMEPAVVTRHGQQRKVKNLGWLLRHWQDVERFEVRHYDGDASVCEAWLVARLKAGGMYETPYASLAVLERWLNRPVFRGLKCDWLGESIVIGGGD